MLEIICKGIFWTLAIYGLLEIIKTVFYVCTYVNYKADGIYLIIAVKNQEEKIEGFLRGILFRFLYGKEESIKEIMVADLNSTDETGTILRKLQKDYDFLSVSSWKDCKEKLDNMD